YGVVNAQIYQGPGADEVDLGTVYYRGGSSDFEFNLSRTRSIWRYRFELQPSLYCEVNLGSNGVSPRPPVETTSAPAPLMWNVNGGEGAEVSSISVLMSGPNDVERNGTRYYNTCQIRVFGNPS